MTQMVDVAVDGAAAVVTVDNPAVDALGERVLEALVDAAQSSRSSPMRELSREPESSHAR